MGEASRSFRRKFESKDGKGGSGKKSRESKVFPNRDVV